jgi:hypothetical protein
VPSKWEPTNKWVAAQGVLATGLASYGFDEGVDKGFYKLATFWFIQAVVTYFTSNHRLPDETS